MTFAEPRELAPEIIEYVRCCLLFWKSDPDGDLIWETVVENVAGVLGLDSGNRNAEAVAAACEKLRIKHENRGRTWTTLNVTEDLAKDLVGLIVAEFNRVKELPHDVRLRAWPTNDNAAHETIKQLQHWYDQIRCCTRVTFPGTQIPTTAAVYVLWRSSDIEIPVYVGETEDLKTRLKKQSAWWDSLTCCRAGDSPRPMHVSYLCEQAFANCHNRSIFERFLIVAWKPGLNIK